MSLREFGRMEYRTIQYQIVQTASPTGFKWTVHLDEVQTRTGVSHTMKSAVAEAQTKIDNELRRRKPNKAAVPPGRRA
jgi:hypothetical protein